MCFTLAFHWATSPFFCHHLLPSPLRSYLHWSLSYLEVTLLTAVTSNTRYRLPAFPSVRKTVKEASLNSERGRCRSIPLQNEHLHYKSIQISIIRKFTGGACISHDSKWGLALLLSQSHKSPDTDLKQGIVFFFLTDICVRKHELFGSDIMQQWDTCFQSVPVYTEVSQKLMRSTWFPHKGHLYHLLLPNNQ